MSDSLDTADKGDADYTQVYERLRRIARRERGRVDAAATLNTTALVHETWLDLCAERDCALAPRDFFAYAATAMRHLLIDHARRSARPKHGGGLARVDLDDSEAAGLADDAGRALELDAALRRLATEDARAAQVVELHYFAGLELDRIAELLDISKRTVNRDWRFARAWLQGHLSSGME